MLRKCHGHGLTIGAIIQIFYHGLDEPTQGILDITAGGIFFYKSLNQAFQFLEDKVLFNLDYLKEELQDMRNKYNELREGNASKNHMNDDTPMCECHEVNYIQFEGYQNQNYHDSYSHQSYHDPNGSEKSLTELNNDVKNDLEDFKRCIRSMRTVHDKLFDRDDGKTTGVLPNKKSKPINQEPQSKTDFKKLMTKFLDDQRVTNMFFKNNVNDMILKMKQNEKNFQIKIKMMERKMDEWSKSQNISLEQTDWTDPPPPQAHTEHVNAVFTGSEKSNDSPKIQKDSPPPIIVNNKIKKDKPIKTSKKGYHVVKTNEYPYRLLKEICPKLVFGDNSSGDTEGYGLVNCNGITFTRVAYVNGLKHNLINISQLCDADFTILFTKTQGTIFNQNNEVVLIAPRRKDVYVIDMSSYNEESNGCFFAKASHSMENLNEVRVKELRSDNGTDFKNHKLEEFCNEKGISQKFSSPCTLKQNGVAERRNKTLIEAARTISIIMKRHGKTAYEVFKRRSPDISYFYMFGCHVYIHNHRGHLRKFNEKANDGFFLGYSLVAKSLGYSTLEGKKWKTPIISFPDDEFLVPRSKISQSSRKDDYFHYLSIADDHPVYQEPDVSNLADKSEPAESHIDVSETQNITISDVEPSPTIFSPSTEVIEPKKLFEALEEEGCIIAMQEELNQFERNKQDLLYLLKVIQPKQEKPAAQSFTPYGNFSMIGDVEVLMKDIYTFLRKFSRIPFGVTPKVILIAWERFGQIKYALTDEQYQQEDIQELISKLLEDVRNISEELSEYINCPSWNRPTFYDDDDDEYTIIYRKPKAITPDLPIEEPDNSLIMGDEHLDTIPSVENLIPIPSEFEGISDNTCDVPVCEDPLSDHSEILSDSNNDDTSSDDDDFEDIEYVSLEEVNDVDQEEKEFDLEDILQIQDVILREKLLNVHRLITNIESLNDNLTPDHVFKSPFSFPIPVTDSDSFFEKSDTSLSYSDNSLPEFEPFSDDTEETRSGRLTSVVISDNSNDPLLELPEFESFHFDPSFPRPPPEPPDVEICLNFKPDTAMINNFDELNEDECFDPGGGEIDVS
ncbi:reverse transcriptase domain-containing protein [Tanacetum coccineum]